MKLVSHTASWKQRNSVGVGEVQRASYCGLKVLSPTVTGSRETVWSLVKFSEPCVV